MYDRTIEQQEFTFRFHPDLFRGNLVIQDVETKSKWSQLAQRAISGPMKGTPLKALPALQTSWQHWKSLHPDTLVLSSPQGLPSRFYEYRSRLGEPQRIRALLAYELVLGVDLGNVQKAYPFSELSKTEGVWDDQIGGKRLRIVFDRNNYSAFATDDQGEALAAVTVYWKNWVAFHPRTQVFRAPRRGR